MQDAVRDTAAAKAAAPQNLIAKLQLPGLSLQALSCGCTSERQLFSWLEDYDLHPYQPADQQRLASMLVSLMDEIGRWEAPASRRLPMLDLLREYTLACVDAIALQRAALANAQTAELRKMVMVAVQLLQHLGAAYSCVAAQLEAAGGLALLMRERRARSLQRGVDSYRRLTRVTALFGLATPQHCWRDMQILVRLAQLHQLADKQVRDSLHPRGRDNVTHAYLQAVLFASANAVQLGCSEQGQLWELSHNWCRSATIVTRYSDKQNALLASLTLDQPPVPANRLGNCKVDLRHFTAPNGWKIDLGGVLKLLRKQLEKRSDPLLERVYQGWAAQSGRSERRTPLQQNCAFVVGIGAICRHLDSATGAKGSIPDRFADWQAGDREHLRLDVESVDFHSGQTVGEYDVALPSAPCLRSDMRAKARAKNEKQEHYRPEHAEVLNCSGHGLGLRLPLQNCTRVRAGELVGIRLRSGWQAAVIRWHHLLPDHCRAGAELMAAETVPVRVQRHTTSGQLSAPIPALLLKEPGENLPTLILPVPLFKCYDTLDILEQTQSRQVTLQRQTFSTGSFARFEFV